MLAPAGGLNWIMPWHFVTVVYPLPCGKVWLSSVVWTLNCMCEACQWRKTHNCWRVGENFDPVLSRLWTRVRVVFRRCKRPLQFAAHLLDCVLLFLFRRYRPWKLLLNREVVEKGDFLAPDLYGEKIPQILDMHFQIALTSGHVARYGLVLFSKLGD